MVVLEVLGIACGFILASRIHRPDLWAGWFAMIVGLHYLPLAKIFRAPILSVLGVSIMVWCVFCWILFRSNALVISVTLGTGILLCAASAATSLRARRIVRTLA